MKKRKLVPLRGNNKDHGSTENATADVQHLIADQAKAEEEFRGVVAEAVCDIADYLEVLKDYLAARANAEGLTLPSLEDQEGGEDGDSQSPA